MTEPSPADDRQTPVPGAEINASDTEPPREGHHTGGFDAEALRRAQAEHDGRGNVRNAVVPKPNGGPFPPPQPRRKTDPPPPPLAGPGRCASCGKCPECGR